jgi:outer membrane autotransporter protein
MKVAMNQRQRSVRPLFKHSVCALAACFAVQAQSQAVQQHLYFINGVAHLATDLPLPGSDVSVPGSLNIGVANQAVLVNVTSPAVTINGDLTLGNVVSNSTTVFNVGTSRDSVNGALNTEGQRLEFTLTPNATQPTSVADPGNLLIKDGTGSGKITAQTVTMGGTETVGLRLTGSLKDGASYHLIQSLTAPINVVGGNPISFSDVVSQATSSCQTCRVTDNSYVISSHVYLGADSGGQQRYLVYQASRAADVYITASNTAGHFSNGAAYALGNIARNGYQLGDLITAITTVDINDYGFGDTMEHLAVQVKRLAPIANNSYIRSIFGASDLLAADVDDRLNSLRHDGPGRAKRDGEGERFWIKDAIQTAKQSGLDDYDGYRTHTNGVVMGLDNRFHNTWLGASLGLASTHIDQQDFRSGDHAHLQSHVFTLYASHESGAHYLDGSVSFGHHDHTGIRSTAIARVADDDFSSTETTGKIGWGYRIRLKDPGSTLIPFVSATYSHVVQPAYTETGAGDLGLAYDAKQFVRLHTIAGLRYNTESRVFGLPAFSTMHLAWGNDQGLDNLDIHARYSGPTPTAYTGFVTPAEAVPRNLVEVGAGLTLKLSKHTNLQFLVEAEHRRGYNAESAHAKLAWRL